jgi:putative ABC transport system permease protein
MIALLNDIKYGFRMLMKEPGFAAIAVMTLAIGIGANITMFGFVNAYLLRPLPYNDDERLVDFTDTHATFGRMSVSYANYLDWRKQNQTFEQIACYRSTRSIVKGTDAPERLRGMQVTANFFPMLGAKAELGRLFNQANDHAGAERTVILSSDLWQRHFGGTPDVIGRTLVLDGDPHTVVGVLPLSFVFPPFRRDPVEFWTPIGLLDQYDWFTRRSNHQGTAGIGKLKDGVTLESARADLNRIAEQLEQAYPDSNRGCRVAVESFHRWLVGDTRPALLVLMGSVLAVLLIVCVNIANLLLVRSSARSQEFSVRRALGAGRLRLVRQLLGENLVLALLGVLGGMMVAFWGLDLLSMLLGDYITLTGDSLRRFDGNMVLFVLATTIGSGLIFGLVPAWHCIGGHASNTIQDNSRTSTSARNRSHLRDALVVIEIALSLVLMFCAGLMFRSFVHYQQADPGYNPDSTVTFDLRLPSQNYGTDEQRLAFYKGLLQRMESIAGIKHVGLTSAMLGGSQSTYYVEGAPIPASGQWIFAEYSHISPDLFRAMGIQLLSGRFFNEHDTSDAHLVVIVDEKFADKWWPDENPMGKRLQIHRTSPDPNAPWSEVVGVVRHVKHYGVDNFSRESIYLCMYQNIEDSMTVVVRAQGDPLSLVAPIRHVLSQIGPDVPMDNIQTLQAIGKERSFMRRLTTTVLGVFALTALLLAALGIYGVMAYTVSRRTNEIGIRIALGACMADIVRMVLRQGARLTFIGIGVGLAGSLALGRLISSFLFGITAYDPITFISVVVVLTSAALLACYLPARRAAKVDPMEALRYE